MKKQHERGMALITALLVLMLISSMIVGLAWLVMTDQKLGGNNADRQRAFYSAEAGMESMTAALAADFNASPVLSSTDINNIMTTTVPTDMTGTGIQYISHAANAPCGINGYCITFTPDASGNPSATSHTILTGQNAGLVGLLTPYTLQVTAMTPQGSEVKLQRVVQTAAIPIFQFGMFCYNDCDFFAGPDFSFGGRLHSNGNLWLAENGGTLTLSDKVTAAGEIIRSNLENGTSTGSSYNTTVNITTNPGSGTFRALATSEGSESPTNVIGALSGNFWTPFKALAASSYNSNIGVQETGILPLNIAIATPSIGGQSIDLIRMPQPGEQTTNPAKLGERYYDEPDTSLRILLSDYDASGGCSTTSDIMQMPFVSPQLPVDLASLAWDGTARVITAPVAAWYQAAGGYSLPMSAAGDALGNTYQNNDGYWIKPHRPIITGCIKIEYQTTTPNAWVDVTQEILKLGLTGRNVNPQGTLVVSPARPNLPGAQVNASGPTINGGVATIGCRDLSPNAILRIARPRDNPAFAPTGCAIPTATTFPSNTVATTYGSEFWPNALYDTREGLARDNSLTVSGNTAIVLSGVMNYMELDINNLAKWFTGTLPGATSGPNAVKVSGYSVYFSDRRGNRQDNTAGGSPQSTGGGVTKTGGFGFEDFVNPTQPFGCPNVTLDQGEDVEGDYISGVDLFPVLRTYGGAPQFPNNSVGVPLTNLAALTPAAGAAVNFNPNCTTNASWPGLVYDDVRDARENPPLVFRRALKLVNGSTFNAGICDTVQCGLTVAAENPVYVQGDYNAQANGVLNNTYVAESVIADAVTLLSDNFNDVNSFAFPYTLGSRNAVTTTYRTAIIGGKGVPFPLAPVAGTAAADYGTDGGAHNFLRYIENWGGQNLWYTGSIVSLFYNHQAVGLYKCCNTVYSPPTRKYSFDTQFLTPNLLPPQTPMLRSVNTISMTQMDLSTQ